MAIRKGLKTPKSFLLTATFCSLFVLGVHAQDPPTRVADLNYITGNVSMQPAGDDQWSPAVVNRPFTTGDYLWTDTDSRAELHLDNAVLRMSPETSVGFLNLDDQIAQIRFAQGEFTLRVRQLEEGQSFEVDTPNAAITIVREGEYRFNADPDSATTWVVVRSGEAEITGGGQAFTLGEGNSAQLSGGDQLTYDVQYAPAPDGFESWSEERDAREERGQSARYLPPDVIGREDLDTYGTWQEAPDVGAVWYPTVDVGWAPYRYGHWAWIEPWGWTWVDDAPWGFAPSHYGRWAYLGSRWGWVPGPVAVMAGGRRMMRSVYAPALVAFIGGSNWGASLSIGGPAVGWVALGPGEVYAPAYHVSQNYFRTVNVSNTRVVNNVNITNVYNNVYVNRTVNNGGANQRFANMTAPNAVTAVPQNAFASGRPVRQVGVTVSRNQVGQIQPGLMTVAPAVAPVRQALAPMAGSRPAVHPPARAISMPVVAKVAPPAPPAPFASKQAILQQNAGRPVNMQAIRQSLPPRAVTTAPLVRVAPPARQVAVPVQPSRPAQQPARPVSPAGPAYRPPVTTQPVQPAQPAPQAYPRPVQPPARPAEAPPAYQRPVPPPARPAEPPKTYERPAQPPARPAEPPKTYDRPPQPPARPAEPPKTYERPAQPPARPAETTPRPQPAQPHNAAPQSKPEQREKPKRDEKPKKDEKPKQS